MSSFASIEAISPTHPSPSKSIRIIPNVGAVGADVTELPGDGATREQISMLHTRYRLAMQLSSQRDVLEAACGTGVGLGCLAAQARTVVAGDLGEENVRVAAEHYGNRVQLRSFDAQAMPFESCTFDVVILLDSIYWLPHPERFLVEAKRVLRPGGTLYLSTSNPERLDFNPCPYATRYFSASELTQFLEQGGFKVDMYAGYPVLAGGGKHRVLGVLQTIAAKLHLIPSQARLKIMLKRLFFGSLQAFPKELVVEDSLCQELIPVSQISNIAGYKLLYAIAHKV